MTQIDWSKAPEGTRSNDDLAAEVASKVVYRFGNLFWAENIRRKDLIGKMAGSLSASDGYRYVKCGKSRKKVAVHRVVFLMHHGYLPAEIDHINRMRDDNRIENLRDAMTRENNGANQTNQSGRSSIYKGVCWDANRGKWSAYIKQGGSRWNLGRFLSEEMAAGAYNSKAQELFGDFAALNVIRTPEQIKAKEIETILGWMVTRDSERGLRGIAEDLHADGYRKQVMADAEEVKS